MNLYDLSIHNYAGISGQQVIAAPNAHEALSAFLQSKDVQAALGQFTGGELRVFKRNEGTVLQSEFEKPRPMSPDSGYSAQPPAAPEPINPFTAPHFETWINEAVPQIVKLYGRIKSDLKRAERPTKKTSAKAKK